MKYTSKLILNWETYEFAAPSGWGWRQPWANTLAYRPLTSTSTTNDLSWNNNNLSSIWTVNFWTYYWVDCACFDDNSWRLQSSSLYDINDLTWITICSWFFTDWAPSDTDWKIWTTEWHNCFWYANWLWWYYRSDFAFGTINTTVNTESEWLLVALTCDKVNFTITVLWQNLNYTQTEPVQDFSMIWTNYTIWDSPGLPRKLIWYISNFIIENKSWTAQEVSDYYNQTKSLYGIS